MSKLVELLRFFGRDIVEDAQYEMKRTGLRLSPFWSVVLYISAVVVFFGGVGMLCMALLILSSPLPV